MAREQIELRGKGEIRFDDPLMRQVNRLRKGSAVDLRQGTNLLIAGRVEEAQAALTRAVTDGPQDATALLNLAVAERRLGNVERACALLERAVEVDPTHSNAQLNLAMIREKQGRVEEAIEHFHLAVESNPRNSAAHLALGRLYWLRRECADSAAHFEQFLKASPDHVQARISQGMCLVRLGEFGKARRVLETGYDAFPANPGIGDALVRVLAASPDADVRDGQRALEIAAALVEALPRPETIESLAMAYAEVGRFEDAVLRQREMIRAVEERGQHPLLSQFRSNLERYERGQACRTPWPPQLFER
jgi:tetratricopeptide (TPR) repeat protein